VRAIRGCERAADFLRGQRIEAAADAADIADDELRAARASLGEGVWKLPTCPPKPPVRPAPDPVMTVPAAPKNQAQAMASAAPRKVIDAPGLLNGY
jgi:hypothetical protein